MSVFFILLSFEPSSSEALPSARRLLSGRRLIEISGQKCRVRTMRAARVNACEFSLDFFRLAKSFVILSLRNQVWKGVRRKMNWSREKATLEPVRNKFGFAQ